MPPGGEISTLDGTDELLLTPSPQRERRQSYSQLPSIPPFRQLPLAGTMNGPTGNLKPNMPATSNPQRSKMTSSASVAERPCHSVASASMAGKQLTARGTSDDPMILSDYESSGAESDGIELLEVRKGPPRRDLHISGIQSISGDVYYGATIDNKAGVKGKVEDRRRPPLLVNPKYSQSVKGPINHPSSLREIFSPKKRSAGSVPVDITQPGSSKARKTNAFSTPNSSRAPSPGPSTGSRQNISNDLPQRPAKRPKTHLDTLELTDSDEDTRNRVHKKQRRDDSRASRANLPRSRSPGFTRGPSMKSASQCSHTTLLPPPLSTRQHQQSRTPSTPPDPQLDVSDYDLYHDGLDIHNEDNWAPIKLNENKLDLLAQEMDQVSLSTQRVKSEDITSQIVLPSRNTTGFSVERPINTGRPKFIWDKLRKSSRSLVFPQQCRHRFPVILPSRGIANVDRILQHEHKLHNLTQQHRYRPCPRSINKIVQKNGWVVSSGACAGGGPDHEQIPEQNLDNENAPGALVAYARGAKEVILDAHKRENFRGQQGAIKYYAVNDAQFLPFERSSFLSTGADGVVQLWNSDVNYAEGTDPLDKYWVNSRFDTYAVAGSTPYPRIPFGIYFNHTPPNSSSCLAAITERKLNIYRIENSGGNRARRKLLTSFSLKSPNSPNLVGSTVWGHGTTSSQLFASSEPQMPDDFSGVHKAFDVAHSKQLYQLNADEGGDDLALDPTGSTLALCTLAEGERNVLRLYDVARKSPIAITTIDLEDILTPQGVDNFTKEVSCSSYSPDGIFLALARTDNSVHVYDTRMLQNGPMFNYSHSIAPNVCANNSRYGVVKAEWIHSDVTRRMGLVTAGEDGCVRLWDPMIAVDNPGNGTVLAEVDYDITTFSIGNRFNEEYPLLVGDSTGQISLFDRVVI